MTVKEKANELIELHRWLSLGRAKDYALTYVWTILHRGFELTIDKREFWKKVESELLNSNNK